MGHEIAHRCGVCLPNAAAMALQPSRTTRLGQQDALLKWDCIRVQRGAMVLQLAVPPQQQLPVGLQAMRQ